MRTSLFVCVCVYVGSKARQQPWMYGYMPLHFTVIKYVGNTQIIRTFAITPF
jgi:hypothetical protein